VGPLLAPAALVAYIVGIFLVAVATYRKNAGARTASTAALVLAWALHLAILAHQGWAVGRFPLGNAAEYLVALGWVVLTLHLLVTFRWNVAAAGFVLPPLAALMTLPALWLPARHAGAEYEGKRFLFIFHTATATAGMAVLALAFAMSLIYLAQDRALKSKRAPALLRGLPSLATCDRIGLMAVLWGFPLLTLGIATGSVWSLDTHGRAWVGGAKQTFPILAWIVFAALLYARLVRGIGGRRSAWVAITGFGLGLLTILGMTL